MIKNKLYEVLRKYIGDYLFGFDKSQLEIAILSGIYVFPPPTQTNVPKSEKNPNREYKYERRKCKAG